MLRTVNKHNNMQYTHTYSYVYIQPIVHKMYYSYNTLPPHSHKIAFMRIHWRVGLVLLYPVIL